MTRQKIRCKENDCACNVLRARNFFQRHGCGDPADGFRVSEFCGRARHDCPTGTDAVHAAATVIAAWWRQLSDLILERARQAKLAPDDAATLAAMNNLALSYRAASQNAETLPRFEELLALYGPMLGNAGSYEIAGNLVTIRPVVAKIPVVMKPGAYEVYEFKIDGRTLSLTQRRNVRGPVDRSQEQRREKLVGSAGSRTGP